MKKRFFTTTALSVAALAVGVMGAMSPTTVQAADFKLTASSSHPPVVPWVKTIQDHVVPESVKRAKALGHEIEWTEAYAGALYNFQNTLEGIADGLGDVGWVGTLWEPNKLPLQNVTFVMPFVTGNVKLAADIQNALHRDIPEMKQAFFDNNQVYLGPQSIDDYVIVSKTPINSVADMKGKKFYAPGASAAWLEGTGAIGVNGGLPVYYNGIQTGVTDGAVVPVTGIVPFKLHEVAPYIVDVGMGGGMTGALTMNKDTFDRLPPELQEMFLELGQEYGDLVAQRVAGFNKASLTKILPGAGATVITLPLEEQKKWADGLPDLAGAWAERMKEKGLPGDQVIKAYMEGVRAAGETPVRNWDQ